MTNFLISLISTSEFKNVVACSSKSLFVPMLKCLHLALTKTDPLMKLIICSIRKNTFWIGSEFLKKMWITTLKVCLFIARAEVSKFGINEDRSAIKKN